MPETADVGSSNSAIRRSVTSSISLTPLLMGKGAMFSSYGLKNLHPAKYTEREELLSLLLNNFQGGARLSQPKCHGKVALL